MSEASAASKTDEVSSRPPPDPPLPKVRKKPTTASYDSAWKELGDKFLRWVLLFFFPKVEADLDWEEDYHSMDTELQKIVPTGAVGDRLADKLIKAKAKDSGDLRVLHFEVQGDKEDDFDRRMYRYTYRTDDVVDQLPEALVVLADENQDWRPTKYEVVLQYTKLTFEFKPVKLLDWVPYKDDLRVHTNPVGLFVLAHLEALRTRNDNTERAKVKLDLLLNLARRTLDEEDIRQFYRFMDWLLPLPADLDAQVYRQAREKMQEEKMPFVTFADRYERQEGRCEGLLSGLGTVLKLKYGEAGLALLPELQKIQDPERLNALLEHVWQAASVEDFRRDAGI